MSDNRKTLILDALRAFVRQRPGFDPRNYGDAASYRGDVRPATQAMHDAETLINAVKHQFPTITADDILKAASGGRLDITEMRGPKPGERLPVGPGAWDKLKTETIVTGYRVDWCAGQYWCVEFRPGVARVLASVLWDHVREHCMPVSDDDIRPAEYGFEYRWRGRSGGSVWLSPGDWLRAYFRREFGRRIADKYFN